MEFQELHQKFRSTNIKCIVVTGGVCSSIGKGVLLASLGVLLKNSGYSIAAMKWDPYLNIDPGTMSPLIHGEVFVTADGAETDLDLGHYERHIGLNVTRESSISSGQIYKEVLDGEREGRFLGQCIQLVPHVVDIIKKRLLQFALNKNCDFVLLEIGGTVGDMEGEVFLEAIRQLKMELGAKHFMHAHLSLIPTLSWTGEIKTKPTQHSVIELKRAGLTPDCLFLRADKHIELHAIEKLSIMCEVKKDLIFQVLTLNPLYRVFVDLDTQNVGKKIQNYFQLPTIHSANLSDWKKFITLINNSTEKITIGLIAKYVGSNDPYISVIEALRSAGYHSQHQINLVTIEAQALEKNSTKDGESAWESLKKLDGILVPGGFDNRGVEGKILAAQWAREHNIPYFGLCLGMQILIIEAARSLLKLPDANSTECNPATTNPVICMLHEQKNITHKGASMRLGSYPCTLLPGTKAQAAYNSDTIMERHRHRYEVNNDYKQALEKIGVVFSGIYTEKNLVEIAEYANHPFMLGTQFHPEFQSSPLTVHPLFKAFVEAVIQQKNKRHETIQ